MSNRNRIIALIVAAVAALTLLGAESASAARRAQDPQGARRAQDPAPVVVADGYRGALVR